MSNNKRSLTLATDPLTSFETPLRPLYRAWQRGLFQTGITLEHLARLAGVPYSALLDEARHHFQAADRARPIASARCRRCSTLKPAEDMVIGSYDRLGRALPSDMCLVCEAELTTRSNVAPLARSRGRRASKQCYKCKRDKLVKSFGLDRRRPDGLNRYCLKCCRERAGKHREKVRREMAILPDGTLKHCPRCERDLLGAEFSIDRARGDGRRIECGDCTRRRAREAHAAKRAAEAVASPRGQERELISA